MSLLIDTTVLERTGSQLWTKNDIFAKSKFSAKANIE